MSYTTVLHWTPKSTEDALNHWYEPTIFPDERVAQVKQVFKKVFGLPADTVLMGSTLPDAILLQPESDSQTFYVFVQSETTGQAWDAMEMGIEGSMTFVKTTPFRLLLYLLSDSVAGMTFKTK